MKAGVTFSLKSPEIACHNQRVVVRILNLRCGVWMVGFRSAAQRGVSSKIAIAHRAHKGPGHNSIIIGRNTLRKISTAFAALALGAFALLQSAQAQDKGLVAVSMPVWPLAIFSLPLLM